MNRKVNYTNKAIKNLRSLDYNLAQKIVSKIAFYTRQDDYLCFAKPLKGSAFFRFRAGDYRVIFAVSKNDQIEIIDIIKVAQRKDIYKNI
jgi:mRNA-degrading endonuclease RelE of RelBE toxin-antitoxin system